VRVVNGRVDLGAFEFGSALPPPPPQSPQLTHLLAVSSDAGPASNVRVFNADGSMRLALSPYGSYSGGVSVATGDGNGAGVEDIITGAGPGAPGGHIKVFDGAMGTEIRSFLAFPGYSGGISVAAGDINGDGHADSIVAATGSAGGHVKVFDGQSNALIRSFL